MDRIHVGLVTNDQILTIGLDKVLNDKKAFVLSDTYPKTYEGVVQALKTRDLDILLLDFFPHGATLNAMRVTPHKSQILLWIDPGSTETPSAMITHGVAGVIYKSFSIKETVECLERAHAGAFYLDKNMLHRVRELASASLTEREKQLIVGVIQGKTNKEIAKSLKLAEGTVKVYFSDLFKKLGVKTRHELAQYGQQNLIDT